MNDRDRTVQRRADRRGVRIVNFSDETDRQVQTVRWHPGDLCARRSLGSAALQFAAEIYRARGERVADLDRHEQSHLCILAREPKLEAGGF